jgi:histidine triad (HIT) family protein
MSRSCPFCAIAAGTAPAEIVYADDHVVAFLDHRPLFLGHTLVIPREHYATLPDLPAALVPPLFGIVQHLAQAVPQALNADGSFIAINNRVSQSVPHLHVHVVPRRRGDGLRGFFWPRTRYASPEEMAVIGARIRAALDTVTTLPEGEYSARAEHQHDRER